MKEKQVTRSSKLSLIGVILVLVSLIAFLVIGSTHRKKPIGNKAVAQIQAEGLVCDQPLLDLGKILPKDAIIDRTFVLTNTNDYAISIIEQSSTCTCTTAEVSKEPIKPGESVDVHVIADWAGRIGLQSASVFLKTNDPANPKIRLMVSAHVMVPVLMSPQELNFGLMKPGKKKVRTVTLAQGGDPRSWQLLKVTNSSPYVSIRRITGKPGNSADYGLSGGTGKFEIAVTAPRITKYFKHQAIFHTNLEDYPEFPLSVSAQFYGAIRAVPATVLFPAATSEDQSFRKVELITTQADIKPVAKIIWESKEPNPFFIKQIDNSSDPAQNTASIIIGLKRKEVTTTLCRGLLRVSIGADQLDIPIFAMGQLKGAKLSKNTAPN